MRIETLLIFISLCSCIPRQKVIYLQAKEGVGLADSLQTINKAPTINEYEIAPGDILSIKVESITPEQFGLMETQKSSETDPLLSGFVVEEDGFVDIPYIGKVVVSGLTISEAQMKIKTEAADELISPTVHLKLLSYSYTVLGEVNSPGTFRSYKGEVTLFEALGSAGDLSDFAERGRVKIIRKRNELITVEYINLLNQGFINSPYYYLHPGDIIYVPPMKVKNFAKYQLPNIAWAVSVLGVISLFFVRIN